MDSAEGQMGEGSVETAAWLHTVLGNLVVVDAVASRETAVAEQLEAFEYH
jgi:hypothetical protein